MSVTTGLQLPFGIQPVNPLPVDTWSGPFTGSIDTVDSARDAANSNIPIAIRFESMEVRLIVSGTSRKFWYKDGIADENLVEFIGGTGGYTGSDTYFFVSGSTDGTNKSVFGGDVFVSGSLVVSGTLLNSNGVPYLTSSSPFPGLIAGSNIELTSGSNGAIIISSTIPTASSPAVSTLSWNFMDVPFGVVDEINTSFILSSPPQPTSSLMLFINGVLQLQGVDLDYTLSSNQITLARPALYGSKIVATYSYQQAGSSIAWMERPTGDIDGMNLIYEIQNVPNPPSSLMFFLNGVLQMQNNDYFLSGKVVTLFAAPVDGTNLAATYTY